MSPIIIGVLSGISVFIITSIIAYFVRKYFFYQPKVIVYFHNTSNSSGLEENNKIRLAWNYDVILKNVTKFDAISLMINYNDFPSNYVTKQTFTHIKHLEEETLKLHFYKSFEREIVENAKSRFKELIPDEFNNTTLLLSYSNEMNKKFYTKYIKIGDVEKNIFCKRNPKIKNRI
jgi:hypothetical protein